ncbi:MAG: hypothetical protein ACYTGR_10955 [Planctomycetota bacterium]|jgi:hypothetical protein
MLLAGSVLAVGSRRLSRWIIFTPAGCPRCGDVHGRLAADGRCKCGGWGWGWGWGWGGS